MIQSTDKRLYNQRLNQSKQTRSRLEFSGKPIKALLRSSIKLIFPFIFWSFSSISYALQEDKQQVLYLQADQADISQSKHVGTYTGNVELDQGTTHLRAAKATTISNENNKLTEAIAYGNNAIQAHYWTTLDNDKPPLHAFANTIYYYPERHIIELVGNAKIAQGENTFSAPKIIYDIERQHVLTKKTKQKRTVITFYPEKK